MSAVPLTVLGPVSAATVAFRSRGRLHLTAVVKATFAIVPEGRMTPTAPDPIILDEQPDPSGRGLRAAGDLAPYLSQADILLAGHAELLPSFSAPELRVWLAVVRDGAVRIDRWLELDASARVGPARAHLDIHGAGPISRDWPRRSQLLGGIDPQRLHGPRIDIPEGFDWSYFQAAPSEQRMELLRGDEWLVLGGVFAQRPKLRTQLPEARAVARLYRRGQAPPREGAPIQLIADTLQIDTDRRCASILWRGHTPVDEAELASLHVVAGIEAPGRAIAWADPFPVEQPAVEDPFGGTIGLPTDELAKLSARRATPFEAPKAPAPKGDERSFKRSGKSDDPASRHGAAKALPFSAPRQSTSEDEERFAGTLSLPPELSQKAAAAPATPFEKPGTSAPLRAKLPFQAAPRPVPERDRVAPRAQEHARSAAEDEERFTGTLSLTPDLASKVAAARALPFERREVKPAAPAPAQPLTSPREAVMPPIAAAPMAPPAPFVEVALPVAPPMSLPAALPMSPPVAPPAPFVEVAPPAPLIAMEAPAIEPEGLGAAFLSAMAEAGEPA